MVGRKTGSGARRKGDGAPIRWLGPLPEGTSEAEAIHHIEARVEVLGSVYRRYRRPPGPLGVGQLALITCAAHDLRVAELAGAAIGSFRKDQRLTSMTLTRSAFESVALLAHLNDQLGEIAAGRLKVNEATVESFGALLFGMRHRDSVGFTSKNVLSLIDKLDRRYKGYRDLYDRLCEYTHPNLPGGLGAFYAGTDSKGLMQLHPTSISIASTDVIVPLFMACVLALTESRKTEDLVRQAKLMNREEFRRFTAPGKEPRSKR